MESPPGVEGYLVSSPDPGRSGRRLFSTFPADWEPPWWGSRTKLDIRVTPLTYAEYHRPLVEIVAGHEGKLRDPQPETPKGGKS